MECPYYERGVVNAVCGASLTRLALIVKEIQTCCATEGHDSCSFLLAYLLRQGHLHEACSRGGYGRAGYMEAAA